MRKARASRKKRATGVSPSVPSAHAAPAGYLHEVGAGLTVVLDSIPLDGRVILRELDDTDDGRLDREAARSRGK